MTRSLPLKYQPDGLKPWRTENACEHHLEKNGGSVRQLDKRPETDGHTDGHRQTGRQTEDVETEKEQIVAD